MLPTNHLLNQGLRTNSLSNIEKLREIMATLRHPEHGCPWDREQDFASIVPHTLEEAYEVAEAIESGDMAELRDELGDLLFQVVFYARLAEEAGDFDFDQVVDSIVDKIPVTLGIFPDGVYPESGGLGQLKHFLEVLVIPRPGEIDQRFAAIIG